jgi:hypothetical protein
MIIENWSVMDLHEFEKGIYEALLKGQIAAPTTETVCPNCNQTIPEDTDGWAKWIHEISIYIYEFTIRKTRKLNFNETKRKAWWAMHRRVKEETVAHIMNVRLPNEPEGLYTFSDKQVCACGSLKSEDYETCLSCAEKKYEEMNKDGKEKKAD